MKTTETAIREVVNAWGVNDHIRVRAIRLILSGNDPDKVVKAIEEIASGLGFLEALEPDAATTE